MILLGLSADGPRPHGGGGGGPLRCGRPPPFPGATVTLSIPDNIVKTELFYSYLPYFMQTKHIIKQKYIMVSQMQAISILLTQRNAMDVTH